MIENYSKLLVGPPKAQMAKNNFMARAYWLKAPDI
jgi:hypothetical protein